MQLATAQGYFVRALANKQSYESYVAAHPGVGQEPNNILGQLNAANMQIEWVLANSGYGAAAEVLASEDYASASAWSAANPGLGGAAYSSGATGSSGGQVSLSATGTGTSGIANVASTVYSLFSSVLNDLQSVIGVLLNPGGWFANLGSGVGAAETSVGQGFGSGATPVAAGVQSIWSALVWPVVIVAGVVALDAVSKGRRRRR